MAMIDCPECDESVSSSVDKCLKCGFQINKPERSFIGKVFKIIFILFNLIMLYWLVAGTGVLTDSISTLSGAEKAGASVGAGIGIMLIFSIWFMGDVILGLFVLFTRPKS